MYSKKEQAMKDQRVEEVRQLQTYKKLVKVFAEAMKELPPEVDLSKGGLGELALAADLGHTLVAGDKGADAVDADGLLYEYKISTTDQFNFNFNARRDTWEESQEIVKKHFVGIEGAWVAQRDGMRITEKAYIPTSILLPYLLTHFSNTKGKMMNKNFRMKAFQELNNV